LQGIDDQNLDGDEAYGVAGDEMMTVTESDGGDGSRGKVPT